MDMKSVCSCVLVLSLQFVCGQCFTDNNCPVVFEFGGTSVSKTLLYGNIAVLKPSDHESVSVLEVRINFTIVDPIFDRYRGHITLYTSNPVRKYNNGEQLIYRVYFPPTELLLPKVTAVIINGDTVCHRPGDEEKLGKRIKTVSLRYRSSDGNDDPVKSRPIDTVTKPVQHDPFSTPRSVGTPHNSDHLLLNSPIKTHASGVGAGGNEATRINNGNPGLGDINRNVEEFYQYACGGVHVECVIDSEGRIRIKSMSSQQKFRDPYYKPVTSRPAIDTVTKPFQHDLLPAPWPVVTARPDHFLSNSPITTYECGVVSSGNERVPLINNGNFYERGEIPWLVAIYRNVEKNLLFICGGTLVSDRHVVTAAHCMKRPSVVTPVTDIVVKIGVHSLNDWSDDVAIIRKLMAGTIHEEYNPNTLQNDVLILTLNKRVTFNRYIRPACLWSGDTELSRVVGATGVVAGWGDRSVESIGGKQDEPRMVRVPIVSTKDCRGSKSDFHRLTYNTTLCAGDRNGAGPCTGDSGGGLYLLEGGKWRLRGVVSVSVQSENGALTCNLNEYVVYTDTAQFLPWIKNILSEKYYD